MSEEVSVGAAFACSTFRWGVATATFGVDGIKSEFDFWLTYVQNRQKRARELSLKSMEYLYDVMSHYRVDREWDDG